MEANRPPPTIEEIAKAAGVAKSTVSMALRGLGKVGPEKRKAILAVAERLGYRPNPLVAAHMANVRRSKAPSYRETIAFLHDLPAHPKDLASSNFYYHEYWNGARERCETLGYRLELIDIRTDSLRPKRIDSILQSRGIRGLIVPPLNISEGGRLDIDWNRYASCSIGYTLEYPQIHRTFYDPVNALRVALLELSRLGYQRIGLSLRSDDDARVNHSWAAHMLYHASNLPTENRIPPMIRKDWTRDEFLEWFESYRPDVVLTHLEAPISWLDSLGLRVPQDVGYATLFGTPGHSDYRSGYYTSPRDIAAAAVNIATAQLTRNECGIPTLPQTTLVLGRWHPGETLRSELET